jgi:lysozyme
MMHQMEGVRNRPYQCPANLWTIGTGHLMYNEQLRLKMPERKAFPLKPEDNRTWSNEEIDKLFKDDLQRFELGVLRMCPSLAGNQGLFDACVSFAYNAGLGNFQRSSIRQRINRGESNERIADAFMMWTKAGGRELKGLVRRRKAEIAFFKGEEHAS